MERMLWLDDYKGIIICLYNEGMKQGDIADEFEVSQTAISTRLRKWGVSNPDGNRFKRNEIDKNELYDMYWNKKMQPSQIAKIYECNKQTITNNLIKYNIPRRTKSEARMNAHIRALLLGGVVNNSGNTEINREYRKERRDQMAIRRGWEVEYSDGTIINENQMDWKKIPKVGIVRATLHYDGRRWDVHNKVAYVQKKRASMIPGVQESFVIESRSIGYYEGNKKIWYTVNEFTGQMNMEVKEL